ncbi:MAG TPA: hypothetical protein VHF89_10100 [Solirubrobacteraceae bacterium]|nr:hypothetical protein [Solirubrobacteraceae bacterium]
MATLHETALPRPFEELAPGARFTTGDRTIRQSDVTLFANLTGESAEPDRLGGRPAPALLLVAMATRLLGVPSHGAFGIRRLRDVSCVRRAAIGDRIHAEGVVEAVAPACGGETVVTLAFTVRDGAGTPVARVRADVALPTGETGVDGGGLGLMPDDLAYFPRGVVPF